MTREEMKFKTHLENGIFELSIDQLIDKIYDDFESRTCESCKYSVYTVSKEEIYCRVNCDDYMIDFGCNRWENKNG